MKLLTFAAILSSATSFFLPSETSVDQCTICKDLVSALQASPLSNNSVQEIGALIDGICENVLTFKIQRDICEKLTASVDQISNLLANGQSPSEICNEINVCPVPTTSVASELLVIQPSADPNSCVDCKFLVEALRAPVMMNNFTAASLTYVIDEICENIPILKIQRNLCLAIGNSISEISSLLVAGVDAEIICEKLNLCPQTPKVETIMENIEIPEDNCAGCEILVGALEVPVKLGNATVASLTYAINEICQNIPILKVQRELCAAITGSIDEIAKLISDGLAPKDICLKLKICAAIEELPAVEEMVVDPNDGTECDECTALVQVLSKINIGNKSVQEISYLIEGICENVLTFKFQRDMCQRLTSSISEVATLLSQGLSPADVCAQIKFCPDPALETMETIEFPEDNCAGCELLVGALEVPVKLGNATVESLTYAINEICQNIPILKIQRDLCAVITGSVAEISKLISDGLAPKDVCQKLKICAAIEEVQLSVVNPKDGNQCPECKFLVEALEIPVKFNNATVQSLVWVVNELCDNIPMLKMQRDLCNGIDASIGKITALISGGLAPSDICEKLSYCPAPSAVEDLIILSMEGRKRMLK